MKKIIVFCLIYFLRFILWFRYRVKIKGLENLNSHTLSKTGGVLLLPNHPAIFVDPALVTLAIWKKYPIRPMVVEYMYYAPVIHWFMQFVDALPVPNFVTTSNSLKKKRADKVIEEVIQGLEKGQNFMIYPAGKIKYTGRESVGGTSAVQRVLQAAPNTNVVLVRTTGLWGSSFSKALTGQSPPMFPTIFQGIRHALKNLLFFTPRRPVTIEFEPAGPDFPYNGSRLEINQYLEHWYNQIDGRYEDEGEKLSLISYSMWKEVLPSIKASHTLDHRIDIEHIPVSIQQKIKAKLAEMAHVDTDHIQPHLHLSSDLGLDSLDNAELLAFLHDTFDVSGIPVAELTTVGKVMGLAAQQVTLKEQSDEIDKDVSRWNEPRPYQQDIHLPSGQIIPEVFLNICDKMGNQVACADAIAGILTYKQAKMRALLLADYIKQLPGDYIGILLPSSVAAYLTVLACQLAGKIPLMVNWTVGSRHLESVVAISKVQVVISAWSFLDRLENVDLNGIEDLIITLEDIRRQLGLFDKVKAAIRSKKKTKTLLELLHLQHKTKDDVAVLLFTSGTESLPKGVPLTHDNILSNQRDAVQVVTNLNSNDILIGILPPFHAYGFTVSGLLPILGGVKVAYFPDPTDGKGVAKAIQTWKATILCSAPSFLKGIFKSAKPGQLDTLRLCATGAEKAPQELFKIVEQMKHCMLVEGYGITECGPILTINKQGDPRKGVGAPIPSVQLCIVDLNTHAIVAPHQQGLVLARGPNVFSGYLNKGLSSPFLMIEEQRWYVTGDLGYLDEQGNLLLAGRLKRFIKIGGEMISLVAIEEALQQAFSALYAKPTDEGPLLAISAKEEAGERSKIFLFTIASTSIETVNAILREAGFSNLVKISKVIQLPEIPLTGTGKTNYRVLEAHINENEQPMNSYVLS